MAVNATGALRWRKDRYPGTKRLPAVVAARTLRLSDNILRAVINSVLRARRRIGSGRWRSA